MNNMIITLAKGIVGESNVKTDEPMSSHTTFRVGGAADLYIILDSLFIGIMWL